MSKDKRRSVDQVVAPEFVAGLESIPIDELRVRRKLCNEVDTELSYYRRLLHGRMDLLAFERRRRAGEEERTLLEALPDILAGSERGVEPMGRSVPVELPDLPARGQRTVDKVLADDFLARLADTNDEELEEMQVLLTELESKVSRQRRSAYEACDRIHNELTRRYR
ncbi:MAG: hypothetical protein ACE5KX_00305, partial [Acidimicrobiia bacterium]